MSLSIRSTVVSIPPAEFPAFIETIRTQITLQTLLATIVIYDAGELSSRYQALSFLLSARDLSLYP